MLLVSTERHVEAALGAVEPSDARTVRSFLRHLGSSHLKRFAPATPEVTLLATTAALESLPTTPDFDTPLLASTLDRALGELRHAGADASALAVGGERGRVLAMLLDATEARLSHAGLFDDRAIGWVAAEVIRAMPIDTEAIDADTVIDGLESFSGGDLAWIETLAERSRVVVRLPTFSAHDGARDRDATAAFSRLASDASNAVLSPLEARWHELDRAPDIEPVSTPLPRAVELVEARSDLVEARAAVRAVLRALDQGAEPERIAIVVPDLDEVFLEPLRAALDEAGVPFAEPRGRPPVACPAGAAALAWVGLALGPVVRDDLVDLVRSRDIAARFWLEAEAPGVEATAHRARAATSELARALAGLAVGADADGSVLSATLAESYADDDGATWMIACVDKVLARLARLRGLSTRRQIVSELRETWTAMGLGAPGPRELGEAISLTGNMRHLSLSGLRDRTAALRSIATGLDRLDAAASMLGLRDAPVGLARARSELDRAIRGAEGGAGAGRSGAVHIARAGEVAGLPHDLVVVTRASEGTFEVPLPSSALLDENVLVGLPPSRRPSSHALSRAASRCVLFRAMSSAQSVIVSRATADGDGRVRAPSTLFAALARANAPRVEPASRLYRHARPLSLRESRLLRIADDDMDDVQSLRSRVNAERERVAFFRDPSARPGSHSGLIDATHAGNEHWASLIGGHTRERPLPTTALERAAGCRFAAFATRVLGATRAEDTGEELDARTRGSLVHRALKIAMEAASLAPPSAPIEHVQALALDAVERVFVLGSPLRRAEITRALTFVLRVVRWSREQDSRFLLWLTEQPFGVATPNAWPALELDVEGHHAYLSGRIDRLDRSTDGKSVRIIDYKTGAIPGPRDEPRLFQLPLYGRAIAQACADGDHETLPQMTALYLGTSAGSAQATPASRQALSDESIAYKATDAARIMAALFRGDVAPRPLTDDVCSHCDARDICRRPVVMPIDPGDEEASS